MSTRCADEATMRSAYALARQQASEPQAIVVLHLDDDRFMLAWGTGNEPAQLSLLPLGLQALTHRLLPQGHLSEVAIEQTIAEVEDILMPWHGKLPAFALLFTTDTVVAELACWAGMPAKAEAWRLTQETVEHLFNRWVARAQGRPASQDELPITGRFSATLLVLREWLHHLGFEDITVLNTHLPDTDVLVHPTLYRS